MKIKVLFDDKRGSATLLEKHFDLIRDLIRKYPNAFWKRCKSRNGQAGYELEI